MIGRLECARAPEASNKIEDCQEKLSRCWKVTYQSQECSIISAERASQQTSRKRASTTTQVFEWVNLFNNSTSAAFRQAAEMQEGYSTDTSPAPPEFP
jgi:hypothetical protein